MTELVWVADWHIQCCGEEFAVADEVSWPLLPADRANPHWEALLGSNIAGELRHSYEGHEEPEVPRVPGVVRGIRTVSCRYAPLAPPADQRELHVVPGTAVIEPVEAIDTWYGTGFDVDTDGQRFCGWLVAVELRGGG
ncbi:hypothetical protein GCM10023339_09120 [Alloalcanivorax gelatiniphagus]